MISELDIERYVLSDLETSIFKLIDAILIFDITLSLKELNTLLQTDNIFLIFSGIMTNLRKILYIQTLLYAGYSPKEIIEEFNIKPFLIEKSQRLVSKMLKFKNIFNEFVQLDRASKIGEIIGDGEIGFELALQKILLSYIKFL